MVKRGRQMVTDRMAPRDPERLSSWQEEMDAVAHHIKQQARSGTMLNILEAGCGTEWGVELQGIRYRLTGVDVDANSLNARVSVRNDLDVAILGDLRYVHLPEAYYNVIFCSNVLEHVDGAEEVLGNFVRWLARGGILILVIPNRDSVKGFVTRIAPFWFHTCYKRIVLGSRSREPGNTPFPTFFDRVVSRRGIHGFCCRNGLFIRKEYSAEHGLSSLRIVRLLLRMIVSIIHLASLKTLSVGYSDLIYVIEKP
jgi:SAM-dependent methyltransferase